MPEGVTDVASYLATRISTGKDTYQETVQDWRTTLYNARSTGAMKPLVDMVRRSAPADPVAPELCESIDKR